MNVFTRRWCLRTGLAAGAAASIAKVASAFQEVPCVKGTVVDSAGGGPIPGMDVLMYAGRDEAMKTTDEDGEFTFDIPKVAFMLVFKDPMNATTILELAQFAGQRPQEIVVDLGGDPRTFARIYRRLQSVEAVVMYGWQSEPQKETLLKSEHLRIEMLGNTVEAVKSQINDRALRMNPAQKAVLTKKMDFVSEVVATFL